MPLEQAWIWVVGALAGWLFLGLAAGRYHSARRRTLASQSQPRPAERAPAEVPPETA